MMSQVCWNKELLKFPLTFSRDLCCKNGLWYDSKRTWYRRNFKGKTFFFFSKQQFEKEFWQKLAETSRNSYIMNIHSMCRITNCIILHYMFCSVIKAMFSGMQTWNCPNSLVSHVHCLKCDEAPHVSISAKGNLKKIYHFSVQIQKGGDKSSH